MKGQKISTRLKSFIKNITCFILLVLFMMGSPCQTQEKTEISLVLEKYVKAEAEHDLFSGAILVAKNDEVIYQGAFGYGDKKNQIPNKIDTMFNVGSVGKTFTGVLIMQLVEKGKIKLADTLDKYLPDFPYPEKRKIQIRHLLNHTSGLGNYFSHKDYEAKIPYLRKIDDALKLVYDQKPLFEPGKKFRYSNSGMLVLGAVIEKVTGKSYREYLKKQLLDPIGMNDSGIFYPEDDAPHRAIGYSKKGDGGYTIETKNEFPAFSDGGLYSTVQDMLKYDRALRENRLLSEETKEIMFTVTPPAENYGLGWEKLVFKGDEYVGHVGGCPGFAADYKSFFKDQIMIIVLSNYTDGAGMVAAKVNHLLFGANEKNIPLATKYDFNFQKGRYLGEVKKDYRASIEYLDKNISGPDPHLPSLFGAARSRIFGNIEVEKAIELLRQYLALNPQASPNTQAAVWWLTGQGYEKLNKIQKARECYRKSLKISPDFQRAEKSLRQLTDKK
ncbi:MAG: serine hydrolase [Candidatus Aminicenantes bacterium]|nr:serine hydrolase [Candidatus Aminicenantes bacterium]